MLTMILLGKRSRCVTSSDSLSSHIFVSAYSYATHVYPPITHLLSPILLHSVFFSITADSPSGHHPFPSFWLVPFLFVQMTPSLPCSFCLSGFTSPRCPQPLSISCCPHSTSIDISLFLPFPCLSPIPMLSHCTDVWLAFQQLSHHVPPPSVASNCGKEFRGGLLVMMVVVWWWRVQLVMNIYAPYFQEMVPQGMPHPCKNGGSGWEERMEEIGKRKTRPNPQTTHTQ